MAQRHRQGAALQVLVLQLHLRRTMTTSELHWRLWDDALSTPLLARQWQLQATSPAGGETVTETAVPGTLKTVTVT